MHGEVPSARSLGPVETALKRLHAHVLNLEPSYSYHFFWLAFFVRLARREDLFVGEQ